MSKSFEQLFFEQVYSYATKSKDESSQLGAVLVNPRTRTALVGGYNGMCRGVDDDIEERLSRPEKYHWFEHAERNAIYNAARNGIRTDGLDMYTNGIPCTDCARAAIQAGIGRVFTHKAWNHIQLKEMNSYAEHFERTLVMFSEAGVLHAEIDIKVGVKCLLSGTMRNL